MAFNKRTWLGRQGVGLNKFSINGASPVTVVNQPDSVTQVGDALSAGNMNDLEDRIEAGFNDVDTALATKADQTEVTNLNDAISQHEARIENLEEAHGSYHEVDVKSVYTIPSGKGDNWLVDKLRGVSRVENNLVKNGSFTSNSDWAFSNCHWSSGKIVSDGSTPLLYQNLPTIYSGHQYVTQFRLKSSVATTKTRVQVYAVAPLSTFLCLEMNIALAANTWTTKAFLSSAPATGTVYYAYIYPDENGFAQNETLEAEVLCRDVTVYFGGTIPSDADTIAHIQTNYPELLVSSDYDAGSSVNTVYGGIRSKARNIFDQETEQGIIYSTGSLSSSTETGRRSADYLPCRPNVAYYGYFGSTGNLFMCWYDSDKNFISRVNIQNQTAQAPSNAYWYKISTDNSYGATYKGDVCINVSDSQNGTYTPYWTPVTLLLSTPVSLKSAGTVADTFELNVEVNGEDKSRLTKRTVSVNLGDFNWTKYDFSTNVFFLNTNATPLPNCKANGSRDSVVTNAMCTAYVPQKRSDVYDTSGTVGFACESNEGNGFIYITDPSKSNLSEADFKTAMDGVILQYEAATPEVTLSDPIINNYIKTESGGTIESILTYDVDDSMTLGYINL